LRRYFILTTKKCRIYAVFGVSQTPIYFFYYEGRIILTNGFTKKTQKTPPREIKIAKESRKDFIERNGK